MAQIEILKSEKVIQVKSPHHPELGRQARSIGGVWTGNSWAFDISLEEEVRSLYIEVFGNFESHQAI